MTFSVLGLRIYGSDLGLYDSGIVLVSGLYIVFCMQRWSTVCRM